MTAITTVDHVVVTIRDVIIPDKNFPKTDQPVIEEGTSIGVLQLRTDIDVKAFVAATRDGFIGEATKPVFPQTAEPQPPQITLPDCPAFTQCVKLVARRRQNVWKLPVGEFVANVYLADGMTVNKLLALLDERAARLKAV